MSHLVLYRKYRPVASLILPAAGAHHRFASLRSQDTLGFLRPARGGSVFRLGKEFFFPDPYLGLYFLSIL